MRLIFCGHTSLEICSRLAEAKAKLAKPCRLRSLTACASAERDIKTIDLSAISNLIGSQPFENCTEILVADNSSRFKSKTHKRYVWSGPLPDNSFYDLGNDIYVCSPEFSLVIVARHENFLNLVALCCEACGLYQLDSKHPKGFYMRPALTSLRKTGAFLDKLGNAPGTAKLRRALKYAFDRSRSPMESAIGLFMSMPVRIGGYGFQKPQLNVRFDLDSEAQRMANRTYVEFDFFFESNRIDVEYESDEEHAGALQIASDSKRNDTLRFLGIQVLTITWGQVRTIGAFDDFMKQLASMLGRTVHEPSSRTLAKRRELRKALLPPVQRQS